MIRPNPSENQVLQLLKESYGITVKNCKPLDGYDDKNYKITVDTCNNKQIEKPHPLGYVLKIVNSIDSQDAAVIEGQNEMMFHLERNGFQVPTPEKNVSGEFYFYASFDEHGTRHAVRLLKYQAGNKLNDAKPCHELYFNVGTLTANVNTCLLSFNHPGCVRPEFKWALKNAPGIMDFIEVIKDTKRRNIVQRTILDFKNNVLSQMNSLEKGIIHGDINEHNILVEGNTICGLIDFGDVNFAPLLLEIASAICYILTHSGDILFGKSFLEGYQSIRKMPELEIKLLKTSISARLCQSLVLGAWSAKDDPTNDYILSTQKNGWAALEKLASLKNEDLISIWFK